MTNESLIEKLEANAALHDEMAGRANRLGEVEAAAMEAAKSCATLEAIAIVRRHESEQPPAPVQPVDCTSSFEAWWLETYPGIGPHHPAKSGAFAAYRAARNLPTCER